MIFKKYILSLCVIFVFLTITACTETSKNVENKILDNEKVTNKDIITNNQEKINWELEINNISQLNETETKKFNKVLTIAQKYKPNENELKYFQNYILNEYLNRSYLSDIKNDKYMLTNIFKSAVIDYMYNDREQLPINDFAFDFLQNTKYTYRGVNSLDSDAVKSNERQMNRALSKMKISDLESFFSENEVSFSTEKNGLKLEVKINKDKFNMNEEVIVSTSIENISNKTIEYLANYDNCYREISIVITSINKKGNLDLSNKNKCLNTLVLEGWKKEVIKINPNEKIEKQLIFETNMIDNNYNNTYGIYNITFNLNDNIELSIPIFLI